MPTEITASNSSQDKPTQLRSFQVGGSAALGDDVKLVLELEPRQTVLVGRNAAGKSAIMEALFQGLKHPLFPRHNGPSDFAITVEAADRRLLHFAYHWESPPAQGGSIDPDAPAPANIWSERCWWEGSENAPNWVVQEGKSVYGGEAAAPLNLAQGTSLLQIGLQLEDQEGWLGTPLQMVSDLCSGARRIPAGIPRDENARTEVFFRLRTLNERRTWSPVGMRLGRVAMTLRTLMRWFDADKDQLKHFSDLGRNLGAFESVDVHTFKGSEGSPDPEEIGTVLFDGVNGGLAADGTLRIAETLVQLVSKHPGLLLIEEPETAIHPGMLSKLLNVIEAYSQDRQVVFSTHSPLVVSHAKPGALRLVERNARKTRVRKLSAAESTHVAHYLEDQGNLGEFVFSGGLDDGA